MIRKSGYRISGKIMLRLKYREVAQQRENADDDHDHAHDLLGAAVDRQHVDEIKDENDDDKGNQDADEHRHESPRGEISLSPTARQTTRIRLLGSAPAGYNVRQEAAMSESPSLIMVQFLNWV